jgi:ABC-type amino acid transport substrate-binding protein
MKNKFLFTLIKAFLLTAACLAGLPAGAQTPLRLARNEKLAEQAVAEHLLKDIYSRAGLAAVVTPLPPARANMAAVDGKLDGEVARIDSYHLRNPALMRVEPAYYYLTTAAFARSASGAVIATRDDLKAYSVGVIRGVQHSMDATEGHPNVQFANSAEQLFLMLSAGRFEVALDTGINGRYMLKKLNLAGITETGILAKRDLFNYLHKKNIAHIPAISSQIRRLADSGELAKMVLQAEKEFLESGAEP